MFFSVLDIVGVLNNQEDYEKNRNYWKYLKAKLKKEGNQLHQMEKKRLSNVMDYNQVIELAKNFPNTKSTKFIEWFTYSDETIEKMSEETFDDIVKNNSGIDQLNDVPLSTNEMQQLIEQITKLRSPMLLNEFINGKTVSIKRDNDSQDIAHRGKEISLKIYDRLEIKAGESRYQIVEQPRFKASNDIYPARRGDVMLLINGMPVIHIELKRTGIPISQATIQIQKYAHEGVFSGLFSLIQIFIIRQCWSEGCRR